MQIKKKIYNLSINAYIFYILFNLNYLFCFGHSVVINKNEANRINSQNFFFVKSLIKKDLFKNRSFSKLVNGSKFSLNTQKRHKEALAIKKYSMTGTSSAKRHHGIKGKKRISKVTLMPYKDIKLPARRCPILGKMDNRNARKISKSGIKTHRIQRVNFVKRRIYFEEEDRFVKLRVSTRGLKTIKKYGLAYCAKKFNLNLNKKKYDAGYSPRKKKKKNDEADTFAPPNNMLKEPQPENPEDENAIIEKLKLNNQNK
ncbi:50S ribosomal protein L28, apicoplast, putative [Plasmodium chabaudi chabaudi]|uniref:50S ribosomal protein L28, apicoplast, putative n=1 Tax=Plasmodium chabaudi chabaudi TaxID=31271 RepID=A0A1C6YIN8_PLACU|nr:50S ribosomal protein L28, apicoplast, putative [Plasmodium chabaudi chabaudi]